MAAVSIPAVSTAAKRLEGKVALITGAASGIGECTARLFSRHGAKVVNADVQDDLGKAVAADLGGPAVAIYVHCDVTDEDQVRAAVDAAVTAYGQLDVMYCNAGVVDHSRTLTNTAKTDFERVVAINLTGTFLATKHAARAMITAGRGGSILMTASVASVMGGMGTYAYTCAKHAIVGLVRSAAVELGQHGIRVNCVSPYGVATRLTTDFAGQSGETFESVMEACGNLKKKVLKAEDVAAAALYLASDDSGYVSGHNLLVDGGYTIVNPTLADFENNRSR